MLSERGPNEMSRLFKGIAIGRCQALREASSGIEFASRLAEGPVSAVVDCSPAGELLR